MCTFVLYFCFFEKKKLMSCFFFMFVLNSHLQFLWRTLKLMKNMMMRSLRSLIGLSRMRLRCCCIYLLVFILYHFFIVILIFLLFFIFYVSVCFVVLMSVFMFLICWVTSYLLFAFIDFWF